MRKDGKYRFTLQFSADNEDQIRVGELLENLGNRKSTVIISALSDYIDTHPELQSGYKSGTSEALEEDITKMLDNLDMFN